MNVFAASLILCQKPLQNFLDSTEEIRVLEFGHLVGQERLVSHTRLKLEPVLTIV